MMKKRPHWKKHIINVSGYGRKFHLFKEDRHPHIRHGKSRFEYADTHTSSAGVWQRRWVNECS
jgi:hypothetical protein